MGNRKKPKDDFMGRQSFQNKESYPTKETGLPEDRFQDKVQTASAEQTNTDAKDFINDKNDTGSKSLVASKATVVKKKMSIMPASDTSLEEGKIVGGVPLGDTAAVMSVAGALPVGIPVDQSRVPYSNGGYRPNSLYGKKISTDNFVINNAVSEQINPNFDEPKDVREAPEAYQGYNGRKQFNTARGKKIYGSHPSATLFERSVDFEGRSAVVSVCGQITESITPEAGYPINLADESFVNVEKGNYLLNAFIITITDGHISKLAFDETRIKVPDGAEAIDQVNLNWQTDANNTAKTMVRLQTELGRETTDKWSPIGYVIEQPYQFCNLFHDGEAILGSLTGACYKTAAHSLAFLQNKMGKEGVRGLSSIAEWLGEDYATAANQDAYNDLNGTKSIFSETEYAKGSAAAMIALFDSTGKYATKADFLNQPRSFKFHLQMVDNNINPFHAKSEFYKALDKVMLFSTFDGKYNPVLPVYVTDEVKVMVPYSLNAWLEGWLNPHVSTSLATNQVTRETGITKGCTYKYTDMRNDYVWTYVDPFVAGLCRWLLRHESKIVQVYGSNSTVTLPIHFTNTTGNMFAFIVCSAAQDMAFERNVIFRDFLFAGEQGVYIWDDLVSMKELNPLHSSQYTYKDYGSSLAIGALSTVSKVRLLWPEVISLREAYYGDTTGTGEENGSVVAYYLPWYFNENAIDKDALSGIDSENGAVMSYPIFRCGVNHIFNDVLYDISERDVRLCLDRMVTVPVITTTEEDGVITGAHHANDFHYSTLRYDDNSDGRVVISLAPSKQASRALRESTYLATPRELGFLFPLPVSFAKPHIDSDKSEKHHTHDDYITGAQSVYLTSYHASGSIQTGSVIDRAASLSQNWVRCFADPLMIKANDEYVVNTGIVPSIACIFGIGISESGDDVLSTYSLERENLYKVPALYSLRSATLEREENIDNDNPSYIGSNSVFSMAKLLWTMNQRYYSPINCFDSAWLAITDGGAAIPSGHGVVTDPLEAAIYFGFSGTLGSDFNQDVLNRLNIKDQLGMFYYKDEFIKSSLIFN